MFFLFHALGSAEISNFASYDRQNLDSKLNVWLVIGKTKINITTGSIAGKPKITWESAYFFT